MNPGSLLILYDPRTRNLAERRERYREVEEKKRVEDREIERQKVEDRRREIEAIRGSQIELQTQRNCFLLGSTLYHSFPLFTAEREHKETSPERDLATGNRGSENDGNYQLEEQDNGGSYQHIRQVAIKACTAQSDRAVDEQTNHVFCIQYLAGFLLYFVFPKSQMNNTFPMQQEYR